MKNAKELFALIFIIQIRDCMNTEGWPEETEWEIRLHERG